MVQMNESKSVEKDSRQEEGGRRRHRHPIIHIPRAACIVLSAAAAVLLFSNGRNCCEAFSPPVHVSTLSTTFQLHNNGRRRQVETKVVPPPPSLVSRSFRDANNKVLGIQPWRLRLRGGGGHCANSELYYNNCATTLSADLPPHPGLEVVETKPLSSEAPPPPPVPDAAPTDAELHQSGLPILVQASKHAKANRELLTELPVNGNVCVSYGKVLGDAGRVCDFLKERVAMKETNPHAPITSKPPTAVAHLTLPGSEYVSAMWGTWATGLCSVPLATSQRSAELMHVLTDSNPEVIFVGGGVTRRDEDKKKKKIKTGSANNLSELIEAAEAAGMSDRIVYLRDVIDEESPEEASSFRLGNDGSIPSMDSPALVMYTSGTTGKPKGVLTTHRNVYHQVTDLVAAWGWSPNDKALHLLPLHHVHGAINILSCAAYSGASCDFQPFHCQDVWYTLAAYADADAAAAAAEKENSSSGHRRIKPNVLMAVPTIYAKLLEATEILPPEIIESAVTNVLSPMRLQVCGSAALPVSVLERWKALTSHTLLERYGMTEFAMALSNPYLPMEKRLPGHVGLPLPSVEVRIMDDETGAEVRPESGQSGELQVRGPTVFREYLNLPDVTAKEFADDGSGFFRTGDIAQLDVETGTYRILGRASVDIIKNGGHKLSALEIERDLLEHPNIAELVVVGVKDEMWGERVGLICRMHRGTDEITLPALRDWAEDRMARYKVPSRLLVVDDIPKNAMGKYNKKELRLLFDANRPMP